MKEDVETVDRLLGWLRRPSWPMDAAMAGARVAVTFGAIRSAEHGEWWVAALIAVACWAGQTLDCRASFNLGCAVALRRAGLDLSGLLERTVKETRPS